MALYRVIVKQSVSRDLKKIQKKDVKRILTAIQALAENPRPPQAKKLSGQGRGSYLSEWAHIPISSKI